MTEDIIDEFLTEAEIAKLTGTTNPALQIKRLAKEGWVYTTAIKNSRKVPIVGRYYTRLRMSGQDTLKEPVKKGPCFDRVL